MPLRFRLLMIALLPLALATACISSGPTATPAVPLATSMAEAAASTATALALARVTSTPPLPTAPPPAASDTPAPSATPTELGQASTAEPSATPSPIAIEISATPQAPATPDPNEAVGDVIYQDPLDGTGRWFWTFADDVAVFAVDPATQQLKGTMLQANAGWRFTVSPDSLQIGNQQVRVTAHVSVCGERDELGLMFRGSVDAEFNYSMYLFKLRCSGEARFELIRGTEVTVLTDWTAVAGTQTTPPIDNTLMVWMAGSEFRFYNNDQYLFSATDSTLTQGFYGLYLYDRTAGGETVFFEDLIARAVNR
jgi:hypothetical protein